jgi:hypothetical protein
VSGGQLLVFWSTVAGLVVVVLAEWWRHREAPPMGQRGHGRLMDEIRRHDDEVDE